jgi:hypothetical protein
MSEYFGNVRLHPAADNNYMRAAVGHLLMSKYYRDRGDGSMADFYYRRYYMPARRKAMDPRFNPKFPT